MKSKMILLTMLLLLGYGYSDAQYGPVVSFTYDDGFLSWWDIGFPIFQEYGFPGVTYINATGWWISGNEYNAVNKLHRMQSSGWEISNHTYNHDASISELEVSKMKNWLDSLGFPNSGFAAPNNTWNHAKVNIVKKYHPYYATGTELPGMSQPFDLYFLQRINLTNNVNIETIKAILDSAVANNKWIIFIAHEFGGTYGDANDGWSQSDSLLRMVLNEVVLREIPVKTVKEVINDLFPPGCVIECAEDSLQYPVLTTFEQQEQTADPPAFNTSVWNEYWHNIPWTGPRYRGSPVVYCNTSNDSLPVMKFYRHVPNGEYEVRASIFLKNPSGTYRLFYSFDSTNTSQYNVVVNKNSEVSLGTVLVTDGQFELYTQNADVVSGGDEDVGWAFIKLITQAYANAKVYLQGSYAGGGTMTTSLNSSGKLPFHHPYNDTLGIWNYSGSERIYNLPADIVDWVLVELRTGTAANTTVGRRAALLKSDGRIVDMDGVSQVIFKRIVPGNYYIVIRHRNHLSIMSSNPVSLSFTNSSPYDFNISQTQAYGTNPMKDLGGNVFGMIAGDANNDGSVNATDLNLFWIPQNGTSYDYKTKTSDFNLDATINATDLNLFWIPENGSATQVP